MASNQEVIKGLGKIKSKFEDREVKNAFKGFNESVQFVCPDIDLCWVIKVTGGEVKVFKEGTEEKPDISISMDSDTFLS